MSFARKKSSIAASSVSFFLRSLISVKYEPPILNCMMSRTSSSRSLSAPTLSTTSWTLSKKYLNVCSLLLGCMNGIILFIKSASTISKTFLLLSFESFWSSCLHFRESSCPCMGQLEVFLRILSVVLLTNSVSIFLTSESSRDSSSKIWFLKFLSSSESLFVFSFDCKSFIFLSSLPTFILTLGFRLFRWSEISSPESGSMLDCLEDLDIEYKFMFLFHIKGIPVTPIKSWFKSWFSFNFVVLEKLYDFINGALPTQHFLKNFSPY